jgi:hypothetical protein
MHQAIGSQLSIHDLPASPKGARALALMLFDQVLNLQERLGIISIDDRLDGAGRIQSEAEKWSRMSADEYRSRIDDVVRDIEHLQQELDAQIAQALALPDRSKRD